MKKYVKLTTSLRERLLFLFTGIISKNSVKVVKPGKRVPGGTYTKYPILPDPPAPEYKSCVPDKPTPAPKPPKRPPKKSRAKPEKHPAPPKPPAMRIVREDIFAVSREEKMPNIPFFELDQDKVKSNL